MPIAHVFFAFALTLSSPQDCREWQECRDLAAAAAERQDYEAFHDLAWRAVQRGPKNDPRLMLLLARAQALSGRPGDALVMLQRLAAMGVATDAATSEDFRRVRALPGWAELEERRGAEGTPTVDVPARTETPAKTATPGRAAPEKVGSDPHEAVEAARFVAPGLTPDGLAYDRVSRRFIVADRHARKLVVVDEFTQSVATLAGAQAAFGDIEAMEIDPRLGDLWVVSSEPAAAGAATTLHKLQLVSGRVLSTFTVAAALAPARFVDVAIGAGSAVLVLDAQGARILRVRGASLEAIAPSPAGATSLAPTDNGVLYVASADGISRVDTASGNVSAVKGPSDADLGGISRIRYHRGSLVAVQRTGTGSRLLHVRLDRSGRAIASVEAIDTIDAAAGAFAIAGDSLFYYASRAAGAAMLKKAPLGRMEKRP